MDPLTDPSSAYKMPHLATDAECILRRQPHALQGKHDLPGPSLNAIQLQWINIRTWLTTSVARFYNFVPKESEMF
jgi:hypothetical protein